MQTGLTKKEQGPFFVTTYALTKGIIEYPEGEVSSDGWLTIERNAWSGNLHFRGDDWHRDFVAAQQRAETMAHRRIASLDKARQKLERALSNGFRVVKAAT